MIRFPLIAVLGALLLLYCAALIQRDWGKRPEERWQPRIERMGR